MAEEQQELAHAPGGMSEEHVADDAAAHDAHADDAHMSDAAADDEQARDDDEGADATADATASNDAAGGEDDADAAAEDDGEDDGASGEDAEDEDAPATPADAATGDEAGAAATGDEAADDASASVSATHSPQTSPAVAPQMQSDAEQADAEEPAADEQREGEGEGERDAEGEDAAAGAEPAAADDAAAQQHALREHDARSPAVARAAPSTDEHEAERARQLEAHQRHQELLLQQQRQQQQQQREYAEHAAAQAAAAALQAQQYAAAQQQAQAQAAAAARLAQQHAAAAAPVASPPSTPSASVAPPPTPAPAPAPAPPSVSRAMLQSVPVTNATGDVTRCPCGDNVDQSGFMIQCETCLVWQHGQCLNLNEKTVPEQYYCERCDVANPIHVAFRRRWGDALPTKLKGKGGKPKGGKAAREAAEAAAQSEHVDRRRTPRPERSAKEAAAEAQAAATPGGHKRKRTAEDSTPTPKTHHRTKKGSHDTHAHDASTQGVSPDVSKRPRLEEQQHQHAQSHKQPSAPPALPKVPSYTAATSTAAAAAAAAHAALAQSAAHQPDSRTVRDPDFPLLSSTSSAAAPGGAAGAQFSSTASELERLAADLESSGGELTPQGSREARKIQRYIQMIQKMEDKSKGPVASKDGLTTPGGTRAPTEAELAAADAELAVEDAAAQQLEQENSGSSGAKDASGQHEVIPPALNNVYSSNAARMARAKLRAEKLIRANSENAATAEADPDAPASSAKRVGRKKKEEPEVPALTPAEIRTLRLTASSQLRPLGPMYFGRKQYLLQGYRDESLRCETGWASALHQELPVCKRVVSNWRTTQAEAARSPMAYHHHHPGKPSSIFPASHPWSIQHVKISKAKPAAAAAAAAAGGDAQPAGSADDAASSSAAAAARHDGVEKMDEDDHDHESGDAAAASAHGSEGAAASGVKLEHPASFFRSIDTTALPSNIQALISSFNYSASPAQQHAPAGDHEQADATKHEDEVPNAVAPPPQPDAPVPMEEDEPAPDTRASSAVDAPVKQEAPDVDAQASVKEEPQPAVELVEHKEAESARASPITTQTHSSPMDAKEPLQTSETSDSATRDAPSAMDTDASSVPVATAAE